MAFMGLTDLTPLEIIEGSFALIFVIITFSLGLILIRKYFKYRRIELILIALFMNLHHLWPAAISFVLYFLFGFTLPTEIFLFLVLGLMPIGYFSWIYTFYHLVSPYKKRKTALRVLLLYFTFLMVILETTLITSLVINYRIVGTAYMFDMKGNMSFIMLYVLSGAPLAIISFVMFYNHCKISEDPQIRWMGKSILLAYILNLIATVADGIPLSEIPLIFTRITIIISSFLNYIAWFMPEWIKKRLIKEEKTASDEKESKGDKVKDFLKIVSTPRAISNEEIIQYRKEKRCLVCKQKALFFKYVCECNALYCNRCAKALVEIENACWVCNNPIDKLKPILFEKDESEEKQDQTEVSISKK